MRSLLLLSLILLTNNPSKAAAAPPREYMELRVYHVADTGQVMTVNHYLQTALVPALHRQGIKMVGVFEALDNDTAVDKRIYLLIPYHSLKEMEGLREKLDRDQQFQQEGSAYWNAPHDKAPYKRYETILLHAFEKMPQLAQPKLAAPKNERVYELRSYEGPTEKLYRNKVQMFNQGGETVIFQRLGFNAVFYSEVICGSRMPNLMYMTSFENKAAREAHWKAFGEDPEWKRLSALPEYQHNVSKADIIFLRPADFSDL
ncbi:MAG: NIPSNAP family protein [Flavisolibacter sp.]